MKIKDEYVHFAAENIARYYEKEANLGERMRANFAELAAFVAVKSARDVRSREFFSSGIPITSYFPTSLDYPQAQYDAVSENKPLVDAKLMLSEAMYMADFCKKTTEQLKTTARLKPSPLLFAGGERRSEGKVALTESRVLKTAFLEFSKAQEGLAAAYVSSFTEACEDASSGISDYCILPIENTGEGILTGMYSLIERYELFICGVCEVDGGGTSTKFALLCRNACGIIEGTRYQSITLRLFGSTPFMRSRLHIGADILQLDIGSSISVPLGYTDGYADLCSFSGSGEGLFAFLLYLGAMKIGYTLVGAY